MSNFSERLKEIRKSSKVTQKVLAEHLGITERAYQHYEYGTNEPPLSNAVSLADYFDVSLDFLTGRSDDPTRH